MTYASQQDLIDRFGEDEIVQLADRDGDGAIDDAVVTKALADADALVDSYIGKRHALPLVQVPVQLARVAGDLAYFFLFRANPTEAARAGYDDALRFLREVSTGTAVLDVAGVEPPRDGATVLTSGPDRLFSRDAMKGF